jgi:hypothetical protein
MPPETPKKKAPPIGIEPRRIWQEKRLQELQAAIQRYRDEKREPELEWIHEAYDLFVELTK